VKAPCTGCISFPSPTAHGHVICCCLQHCPEDLAFFDSTVQKGLLARLLTPHHHLQQIDFACLFFYASH
jgi:hypothetical protein